MHLKLSMIIGCNNWMICLELNWFFTIRVICCNFLYCIDVTFFDKVCFNNLLLKDATDKSKISSDQKRPIFALSLYPLSFFPNTTFKTLKDFIQDWRLNLTVCYIVWVFQLSVSSFVGNRVLLDNNGNTAFPLSLFLTIYYAWEIWMSRAAS